ncbi:MAG: hypothetical protein M3O70_15170 [Actinomycetota bacterium]|nr:hypothetical protein [Actinomycetota bacterium]
MSRTATRPTTCEECGRSRNDLKRRQVHGGRWTCKRCYQSTQTFTCPRCGDLRRIPSAYKGAEGKPVQCSSCVTQEEDVDRFVALACEVARVEPDLPADALVAAIEAAAPSVGERQTLAENLGFYPGALTSGAASATRVLWRLVLELEEVGATAVVRPRCADCSKPRELVAEIAWSQRICADCDRRRHAQACARCGTVAVINCRTVDGEALCRNCWNADPSSWKTCAGCGERGRVNARTRGGQPICMRCYRDLQPRRHCHGCGRKRPMSLSDGDLCGMCYRRVQPRRRCGSCGSYKRISKKARDGQPDLCAACNWAPIAVCSRCGDETMCRHADGTGPPVCLRCLAMQRLDALLTAPDGTIPDALASVRSTFFATRQPRSLFVWLDRSPGARLLRQLATGEVELSHKALDAQTQTPSLNHLRQLLIACGALPERDPQLALLERAIDRHVASLHHDEDRRTLRAFATWHVLARLRRRYPAGDTTPSAAKGAKHEIAEAGRFLTYLHQHGRSLTEVTQPDLDDWLADGAKARLRLRSLIVFAAGRGIVDRQLHVPVYRCEQTRPPLANDERWAIARRLLHDDGLDPADRVVGTLVVLYAQPLARISRLHIDDIVDDDRGLYLSFGRDRVLIPQPLAGLLRQLPSRRQIGPSGSVADASRWLFPGRQAGQPIHPDYLRIRLKRLGIPIRPARKAALLQLARQVPAAVLADMLGISITNATAWAARSGGAWHRYAAARATPDEGGARS